jgi:hypothetical protein
MRDAQFHQCWSTSFEWLPSVGGLMRSHKPENQMSPTLPVASAVDIDRRVLNGERKKSQGTVASVP